LPLFSLPINNLPPDRMGPHAMTNIALIPVRPEWIQSRSLFVLLPGLFQTFSRVVRLTPNRTVVLTFTVTAAQIGEEARRCRALRVSGKRRRCGGGVAPGGKLHGWVRSGQLLAAKVRRRRRRAPTETTRAARAGQWQASGPAAKLGFFPFPF
jgi:hypothetical protein